MQKAVSTYLFVKERLHPGILDGLQRSGVQAVEIFAARQHMDYANRKSHVKEIAEWFRGSGIPLNSVHSPLYADYEWGRAGAPPLNICSTDRATRVEAMDEIKRALEIAEQIPFRFLVQHLGTPNESFSDKKFEAAMTSIEHLRAFAKPLGVRILLENIPNELSTPDHLVEMIRTAQRPMIVASTGVFYSKAWDALKQVAEKANIAVVESGVVRGQFLVEGRNVVNVERFEKSAGPPEFSVVSAKWRAWITADQGPRTQSRVPISLCLFNR